MIDNERLSDERIARVYGLPLWAVKASRLPDRVGDAEVWHDEAVRLGVDPILYIECRRKEVNDGREDD